MRHRSQGRPLRQAHGRHFEAITQRGGHGRAAQVVVSLCHEDTVARVFAGRQGLVGRSQPLDGGLDASRIPRPPQKGLVGDTPTPPARDLAPLRAISQVAPDLRSSSPPKLLPLVLIIVPLAECNRCILVFFQVSSSTVWLSPVIVSLSLVHDPDVTSRYSTSYLAAPVSSNPLRSTLGSTLVFPLAVALNLDGAGGTVSSHAGIVRVGRGPFAPRRSEVDAVPVGSNPELVIIAAHQAGHRMDGPGDVRAVAGPGTGRDLSVLRLVPECPGQFGPAQAHTVMKSHFRGKEYVMQARRAGPLSPQIRRRLLPRFQQVS